MSNKNKKDKIKCSLVLYIGSSFVEAQLVDFSSEFKTQIIFNCKNLIKSNKNFKIERFLEKTNDSLKKVCEKIIFSPPVKNEEVVIKDIQVSFSSPWYSSKTESISFFGKEEFDVSKDMIEEAIELSVEEFLKEYDTKEKEKIIEDNLLMERKGLKISLNGYSVEEIENKKASELMVNVFLTVLSEKAHDKFTETLSSFFNEREVYFHSLSLASFTSIRDEFSKKERFAILNMEGETTEITFVLDGVMQETTSFPKGLNSIIRSVTKSEKKKSIEEIRSKINLYVKNELEEKEAKNFSKKLNSAKEEWVSWFSEKIEEFSNNFSIPDDFYIISPDHFLNWVSSIIKDEKLYKHTVFEKPFDTYKIDRSNFVNFMNCASSKTPSPYIMITTLYLKKYKYF